MLGSFTTTDCTVDQLPTPSAEPDAEGATSQLPPINPTAEITSEGRGRKRSTEEVTTVYEEGKIIEAEGEASVVVGATVKEGEAVGVVVVSELQASRLAKRLHITLSSLKYEGEDEASPTEDDPTVVTEVTGVKTIATSELLLRQCHL
ncbi:unnamed protein product [Prunus armeniaca]|uniref:Uncharacterized protein n=1 Tax=Prunus armeniaca TaxID=36596 RepID=A0A6J5XXK7_PRUAR|nr:unnamed protein product [Prunus armeniaca]CAB4316485.1 unnamed protein product [Prunus armeniaca]